MPQKTLQPEEAHEFSEPVTLELVGKRAGVSRSTVSRVINNAPGVSRAASEAVLNAISELGYIPNRSAQSLATKRAAVVTALIPERVQRVFGDPFFGTIIDGIDSYLNDTDLILNLMLTSNDSFGKALSYLAGGQSDGVLVLSHHCSHSLVQALESRVPVVYGGRPATDAEMRTYVDVDNVEGGRKAARYLASLGLKRIGMIGGSPDMLSASDRLQGFKEVMGEEGRLGPIEMGDYSAASGKDAARRLLERGEAFDGLFVANDLMARAAVGVFRAAGLSVPGDVAVVGFDDSVEATSVHPHLTTIRQDPFLQGWKMAELLSERLQGAASPKSIRLPTELIVRESA